MAIRGSAPSLNPVSNKSEVNLSDQAARQFRTLDKRRISTLHSPSYNQHRNRLSRLFSALKLLGLPSRYSILLVHPSLAWPLIHPVSLFCVQGNDKDSCAPFPQGLFQYGVV